MEYMVCFITSSFTLNVAAKRINKISGKIIFVLSILIPVLLATFRSIDVGIDVLVYIRPYAEWALNSNSFMSYIILALTSGLELGYAIINYIGAVFFGGLSGVFFLSAVLSIVPVYMRIISYKNEIPVWEAAFIFLLIFYNLSLNLTRQAIAMSILFFALKYVEEKKYKYFFVFLVIAFLFHNSALLGAIYPIIAELSQGKDWKIKQFVILAALIAFVVFYNHIFAVAIKIVLPSNADKYIKTFLLDGTGYLSFWVIVINIFIVGCVLFSANYLKKINCYKPYLLIAMFNLIIYMLTMYNGNCFRYALYFMIITPRIVPLVRYKFNKKSRFIIDIMMVMIFVFYWINFNLLSDSYGTIPYSLMS